MAICFFKTNLASISMNREAWLLECVTMLRPTFSDGGYELPEKIRCSCSWPSKSGLAKRKRRIGEVWSAECSGDASFEVFISPVLKESGEVAATLVHELVHTAVGIECKHRKPFTTVAKAIGLEGKMTETVAGTALTARLQELIETLGEYPHARLVASNMPKTQTTRMLKVTCKECGCVARLTRKWLDEAGTPTCGCGGVMKEEGGEETEEGGDK